MSNTFNYCGISNKTDARQMVAQVSEEDCCHFHGLSKEAKVALLYGLCQAETGFLWSRQESLTYSCSLNEGDHTGEDNEEISVEGETEERQSSEREKHISEEQQGAACIQPQYLVINSPSGAFSLQTQTGFQLEWESAPLFSIGDEGFSFSQLYWGIDIIPQFMYVIMAQHPWTNLKQRITNSGEGFHAVKEKELVR
ncbi:hypothetical protein DSO57_1015898 [Entomophthora muscae]|uniref:Uncharacterized protein n=1 Tax=Entomophthora muscae TaxID=34485 RepID=A0ACC2S6V0_9FUNG|nr:hypothetical protein DSO57_1015898 [Entomophthora muscae]